VTIRSKTKTFRKIETKKVGVDHPWRLWRCRNLVRTCFMALCRSVTRPACPRRVSHDLPAAVALKRLPAGGQDSNEAAGGGEEERGRVSSLGQGSHGWSAPKRYERAHGPKLYFFSVGPTETCFLARVCSIQPSGA
jgi:hypothetical protein